MSDAFADGFNGGRWVTISGRRVFIKGGESVQDAMRESGKFESLQNTDGNDIINYRDKMKELESDQYPDFATYNLQTLEEVTYESGFQVTFCQIGDDFSDEEFSGMVKNFKAQSSDGVASAGKFENTPEISFNVKSQKQAISLAKDHNQISIWDWKNGEEIKTGGTGRRRDSV